MATGVADGTGPLLQHVVGGTTAGTVAGTVGGTTAGTAAAGLGVADGTGPLLLHPTATAVAGTTGATVTKTAVGAKVAALSSAVGGVLGIVLTGAAVGGAAYLGYRLVKALTGRGRAQTEEALEAQEQS